MNIGIEEKSKIKTKSKQFFIFLFCLSIVRRQQISIFDFLFLSFKRFSMGIFVKKRGKKKINLSQTSNQKPNKNNAKGTQFKKT